MGKTPRMSTLRPPLPNHYAASLSKSILLPKASRLIITHNRNTLCNPYYTSRKLAHGLKSSFIIRCCKQRRGSVAMSERFAARIRGLPLHQARRDVGGTTTKEMNPEFYDYVNCLSYGRCHIDMVHHLRESSQAFLVPAPRAGLVDGAVLNFFPVLAVTARTAKPSFQTKWQSLRRQVQRQIKQGVRGIPLKTRGREYLNHMFRHPLSHFCFLACLAGVLLFANLHQSDLSGYDDAAYAHVARVLLQNGDWWTMRLNGTLDFDKPPLFIWMEALSFSVLGESDLAAKLPSALFGFATILLVFFLARELTPDYWIPVLSMLVLMSTQYFLKYSVRAMTNVPFTFFFTLAIY